MNTDQLIQTITRKVVQKLGNEQQTNSQSGSGDSSNESCNCPPAWDGIGTVSDIFEAGASRIGTSSSVDSCPDRRLAQLIDHTMLKPDAVESEIIALCNEAKKNCFMSVCVNSYWISTAKKILRGSGVKVCCVVGFPLGATFTRVKVMETRISIDEGADEIDMVINVGALKSGKYDIVEKDIMAVVQATRGNVISKVILEVGYLTSEEIKIASELSAKAGANFVKTSTGFGKGGATVEAIRLMRKTVGNKMGVKASGGVRDQRTALDMISAGASRIGASASVAIVHGDESGKTAGY